MDLFDSAASLAHNAARQPLAVRMRPATLEEVVGQDSLIGVGSPIRQLVEPPDSASHTNPASVILWGPPGTGKTTFAYVVAGGSGRRFVELSAVTAGVKDVRAVIDDARRTLALTGEETVLFIDEVHRFSKSQQDALLPSVENQWVTLIAATTENPYFSVISPLLSRSILVTLQPLDDDAISRLLQRAVTSEHGLASAVHLAEDAEAFIIRFAGGDARRALTTLEAAAAGALARAAAGDDEGNYEASTKAVLIEVEDVESAIDTAAVRYDRAGDQHYDVASAFIKSMRGSDVDAALHYLARMIVAGEDPRFIARRIMIAASEEVAMADPSALQTAVVAAQAVAMIGWPEAQLILAQAVVHVATAPKSNAVTVAIGEAVAAVRAGKAGPIPAHLRDGHYAGAKKLGHTDGYVYAHDAPFAIASQQYAPDEVQGDRYYRPNDRGFEREVSTRLVRIREILDHETS